MSQPEKPKDEAEPSTSPTAAKRIHIVNPFAPDPASYRLAAATDAPPAPPVFIDPTTVPPVKELSAWQRLALSLSLSLGASAIGMGAMAALPPPPISNVQTIDTNSDDLVRTLLKHAVNWSIARCCAELGRAVLMATDELDVLEALLGRKHREAQADAETPAAGQDGDAEAGKVTQFGLETARALSERIRPMICGNKKIAAGAVGVVAEEVAGSVRTAILAGTVTYAVAMVIACTAAMIAKQGLERFCKGEAIKLEED